MTEQTKPDTFEQMVASVVPTCQAMTPLGPCKNPAKWIGRTVHVPEETQCTVALACDSCRAVVLAHFNALVAMRRRPRCVPHGGALDVRWEAL